MMKKEVKHLGISTSLLLMIMVVFGTLVSSCYTKDDIPVTPKPEVVPNTYLIQGSVISSSNGVIEMVKDVAVTCNGVPAKMGSGSFSVYVTNSGEYTLKLTAAGYRDAEYKVYVPAAEKENGQLISISVTLAMYKGTLDPSEPGVVTPEAGGTLNDEAKGAKLVFPAGAVAEDVKITMTVNNAIESASNIVGTQEAGAQFMEGTFGPSGLKFSKPVLWSVDVQSLANYYLTETELQYRANDGSGSWSVLQNGITYKDGKYAASLASFSQYRMVYRATSVTPATMVEKLPAIATISNTDKAGGMTVETIPYKKFEGAELTLVGDEWNNLGTDRAKIEELVKAAISAKLNVAKFEGVNKDVDATLVLEKPIKIAYEYHLLLGGTQDINTYKFTFNVVAKDNNKAVTLKADVKVAGNVTINFKNEYCGAHHHTTHGHCGHVYNGGAGGGMVVGE